MQGKNFKIVSAQLSIFTPVISFSKNKILEKIISKYADVFTGDTIAVPLPADAPKDIPRIILNSTEGKIKLEISESRINIFRNQQGEDTIDLKKFLEFCLNILKDYKECANPTIGRIALVTVKCLKVENPGLVLAKHFCKEDWLIEPFNRPENFELHSHKKYNLKEFHINSWVRCKTAKLVIDDAPVVLVTQDINTLAEEMNEKDFGVGDVKQFIELVVNEQNEILNKYFPE